MTLRAPHKPRSVALAAWAAAALLAAGAAPSRADLADRLQPIVIEADKPGTLDLQRQVMVFAGDVRIEQGTMSIRAERIEIQERPDGSRTAVALGLPGRPATYRQKREGLDEFVEGQAQRIEYDGRSGALRLVGEGVVRRLRGERVADEITGAVITWDDRAELFSVAGAASGASGAPGTNGRVRAVLTPLAPAAAASAPR